MERLVSVVGIFALLLLAWLCSSNRRVVQWRVVIWGMALQFAFALFILRTPIGLKIFDWAREAINTILGFTTYGAAFVFGHLALNPNNPAHEPLMAQYGKPIGLVFFFGVLTTIIFFASLMSILYHLGIMQAVVKAVAWVMVRTMGTSGAESLSAASNIFVGQTEAPLVVRPYVAQMTRSELMAVMTGGFATIAGGVMAAYVAFGIDAGHLLTASVISAPASLVMAKLMEPETEEPLTKGTVRVTFERTTVNLIDAAAVGAADGLRLAFNVAAMLVAFLALLAMINAFLGWLDRTFISLLIPLQGRQVLSLETLLGYLFAPLAFLLGTPTQDVLTMGSLMGIKVAANEFVAYVRLADLKDTIDPRTFVLATYALCGFANFGSIAIQIGGISAIAPERRADLARLGLKAMWAGALATWLTACVAGTLISEREARWRYLVDLSKRTEQVKVFVQPYEIAKEFVNSDNPKERELAEEVLEKLKERAKRLWDETEQKVQRLLKEGKRNEAIKAYEDFARQIAFPEWQRKAWEKAKSLREQQGG